MIHFVSGHIDLTQEEWDNHYKPLIDQALEEGDGFVLSDCPGCDSITQDYLADKTPNVRICLLNPSYEAKEGEPDLYGRNTYIAKGKYTDDWEVFYMDTSVSSKVDAWLTEASHVDIAWIRPGKEASGTANNRRRRCLLYHNAT